MTFWKTEKFKKLQKKWYGKLLEDGFVDVEKFPMTSPNSSSIVDQEAIRDYYSKASDYLYSHKFSSLKEWVLWFLHSEGIDNKLISKTLNMSQSTVSRIVAKYRELM